MADISAKIVETIKKLSAQESPTAIQIAREMGLKNASEVNSHLYKMQSGGVLKSSGVPPRWSVGCETARAPETTQRDIPLTDNDRLDRVEAKLGEISRMINQLDRSIRDGISAELAALGRELAETRKLLLPNAVVIDPATSASLGGICDGRF